MTALEWKPDKNSKTPLHEQIKDFIINKVSTGDWYVGFKLPTQRELSELFQVNRSTLKSALEDLTADGILDTNGKGGTFVKNNTWTLFTKSSAPDWRRYLKSDRLSQNLDITQSIHNYEYSSDLIRLSTGELAQDLFPREEFNKTFQSISDSNFNLNYNHPKGLLPLRESLARYYKDIGVDVNPSQILVVSGAIQAIYLISVGLLPRGTSVLCEVPSYLCSLNIFKSSGVSLSGVQSEFDGVDLTALRSAFKKNRTSIFYTIPYFQNPTGTRLSDRKRRELLALCHDYRLPVIEDDTYRELYYDDIPPLPLKASDDFQSVIHVGSASKSLCAGLRVGWIIGQEEIIDKLADLKMQIDYGTSTLSQLIFNNLLVSGEYQKNLARLRHLLREKRDVMLNLLEDGFSDLATWNSPTGGFYVWLKLKPKVCLSAVFEHCIQHGVLINPGYMYDRESEDTIRLSFSYAGVTDIEKGLKVLKQAIIHEAKI
ncbi:PLP-dependent aminotransferase family protein [Pseudomonas sp. NPDC088444]|uniref:aminotransferase-like domain-containing protein n=1 Tax=Pseudomonas sp. NPDC088444 TaxID=3364456 RepID=UPI00385140F4